MITLLATIRSNFGKGATRRLRFQGQIPAVVYGKNQKNLHIRLTHKDVWHLQERDEFLKNPVILEIFSDSQGQNQDAETISVRLKAIQRHAFKPNLLHIDFMYLENAGM